MTDLRKAAEMALKYFEEAHGLEDAEVEIKEALRQALDETPPCKTHPDAPHGFDRNASHSADRYVCECEGWKPVDNVDMSEERVHKTEKSVHEWVGLTRDEVYVCWKSGDVVAAVEAKLKEKNGG